MTDMTAEWFADHDFLQLGKADDGRAMLLVTEDEYNAIRQALTAPRVPEDNRVPELFELLAALDRAKMLSLEIVNGVLLTAAPSQPVAPRVPDALPYWPACNPACDPEFGGFRTKGCHCEPARAAMLAAAQTPADITLETDLGKMSADYPGAVDWTGSSAEPAQDVNYVDAFNGDVPMPAPDESLIDALKRGHKESQYELARLRAQEQSARLIIESLENDAEIADAELANLRERVRELEANYSELLYQVHEKIDGQTRHQTALARLAAHNNWHNAPEAARLRGGSDEN